MKRVLSAVGAITLLVLAYLYGWHEGYRKGQRIGYREGRT